MADKDDKDKGKTAKDEIDDLSDDAKAYIASAIRRERRRHEAELADLRDELMPEPGGKGDKPFDQEKDGNSETQQLRRKVSELEAAMEQNKLTAAAVKAALAADVDPKRAERLVSLANLDGIKSTDRERIAEAISEAVTDWPEFVAATSKNADDTKNEPDTKKADPEKEDRPAASTRDASNSKPATADPDVAPGIARMRAAYAASETS